VPVNFFSVHCGYCRLALFLLFFAAAQCSLMRTYKPPATVTATTMQKQQQHLQPSQQHETPQQQLQQQ